MTHKEKWKTIHYIYLSVLPSTVTIGFYLVDQFRLTVVKHYGGKVCCLVWHYHFIDPHNLFVYGQNDNCCETVTMSLTKECATTVAGNWAAE